ncbi:biotin--[acetyl-CoA-carboxylase] ligase, partial [Butyrivibrio sp. WCE2006]|uniref:biotin--[acetyl-CoA-carboxylase] ligase n=1 Tax=Butyrivibrio sp. WCE2006 TaxID=1410611 RepID=UPI0005D23339
MLSKEAISAALTTEWMARNLEFHPVIDSTNNVAKAAGLEDKPSGYLVVADKQEAGRGSRGRSWDSPAGNNVFMSLMVRPGIPMDKVSGLTLVMALSISQGIDEVISGVKDSCEIISQSEKCRDDVASANGISEDDSKEAPSDTGSGYRTGIKWPNDIVLNKRKTCGILTELHMMPEQNDYFVVIGVGINVNQPRELFPEEIQSTAGSILSETGKRIDRSELIALCMKHFEKNYEQYIDAQNLAPLREQYEERLINIGKEVRVLDPKGEYEAKSLGVTDEGALIIVRSDGKREEINAGEVSIRGLYGYV